MLDTLPFENQTSNGVSDTFVTNGLTSVVATGTWDGASLKLQIYQKELGLNWSYTGDVFSESGQTSGYLGGTRRALFRFELINAGASTDITVMAGG